MSDRLLFALMATVLAVIAAYLLTSCSSVASLFWRDSEIAGDSRCAKGFRFSTTDDSGCYRVWSLRDSTGREVGIEYEYQTPVPQQPTPRVENLDDLLPEVQYDDSTSLSHDAQQCADDPKCESLAKLSGTLSRGADQNAWREGLPASGSDDRAGIAPGGIPGMAQDFPCVMQPRPRPCPPWDYHCDQTQWNWSKHWPQFAGPPSYGRWECR